MCVQEENRESGDEKGKVVGEKRIGESESAEDKDPVQTQNPKPGTRNPEPEALLTPTRGDATHR